MDTSANEDESIFTVSSSKPTLTTFTSSNYGGSTIFSRPSTVPLLFPRKDNALDVDYLNDLITCKIFQAQQNVIDLAELTKQQWGTEEKIKYLNHIKPRGLAHKSSEQPAEDATATTNTSDHSNKKSRQKPTTTKQDMAYENLWSEIVKRKTVNVMPVYEGRPKDPTMTRNHMKEIFARTRNLIEGLWEEMHIEQKERETFSRDFFYPETRENYIIIFKKISSLCKIRSAQHQVLSCIERREGYIARLKEISKKISYSGRKFSETPLLQNEVAGIVTDLRNVSVELAEAITRWRAELTKKQVFIYNDKVYLIEMQNDLDFLKISEIAEFFDFPIDNNPLLLSPGILAKCSQPAVPPLQALLAQRERPSASQSNGDPSYNDQPASRAVTSRGGNPAAVASSIPMLDQTGRAPNTTASALSQKQGIGNGNLSFRQQQTNGPFIPSGGKGRIAFMGDESLQHPQQTQLQQHPLLQGPSATRGSTTSSRSQTSSTMVKKVPTFNKLPPLGNTAAPKTMLKASDLLHGLDIDRLREAESVISGERDLLAQLELAEKMEKAAIRIQCLYRGYMARLQMNRERQQRQQQPLSLAPPPPPPVVALQPPPAGHSRQPSFDRNNEPRRDARHEVHQNQGMLAITVPTNDGEPAILVSPMRSPRRKMFMSAAENAAKQQEEYAAMVAGYHTRYKASRTLNGRHFIDIIRNS